MGCIPERLRGVYSLLLFDAGREGSENSTDMCAIDQLNLLFYKLWCKISVDTELVHYRALNTLKLSASKVKSGQKHP